MEEELIKKTMPNSLEAEQSVIGSMLYSQDAIGAASEVLTGEDFYQHQYGVLFDTILELYNAGKPTDIVTLQEALKTKDVAPEVYSVSFLMDLLNSVFTAANIRTYATIVSEKAMTRRMIKTMEGLINDCYMGKKQTPELMADTEKAIFQLLEKKTDNDTEDIETITLNVIGKIEEAARNGGAPTGVETGFADLDEATNGLQPSDLILIAARPAMGKTAFALNLAHHFAVRNHVPTAVFELEMTREQLVNRMLAMESHVDSQKLRNGKLSDMEWDQIVEASADIAGATLYINDNAGITITELRSKCRKLKLEHDIKVIIVDYLQLMSGNNRESRQQEISEISRNLKVLARELRVPVIALSQLSRGPEGRQDHRPMLADLRESGAIEQDADIVMFIYRDEYYNPESEDRGKAEIIIAKQRSGPTKTIKLAWIPEQTRFANLASSRTEGNE